MTMKTLFHLVILILFCGLGTSLSIQVQAQDEPMLDSERLDLLDLATLTAETLPSTWVGRSTGTLSLNLDPEMPVSGFEQALYMRSELPCVDPGSPRSSEITYQFEEPHDFSGYSTLTLWVRAGNGSGGELSVVLGEADGEEWQSSRYFSGVDWQRIDIALEQGAEGLNNPWSYPSSLVLPTWYESPTGEPTDLLFDPSKIQSVRLRAYSVSEECADRPVMEVWFGAVYLSNTAIAKPLPVELPVIDTFDYESELELRRTWRVQSSGTTTISLDDEPAQSGQAPALHIATNLPCGRGRGSLISRSFAEPLDLSGYSTLLISARGDGISDRPYGGEFSVILWDRSGQTDELWQSSRWLNRAGGWIRFEIALSGSVSEEDDRLKRNPWRHRSDFTIPFWEMMVDGQLDRAQIVRIGLRANTTDAACRLFPASHVWVDEILVR